MERSFCGDIGSHYEERAPSRPDLQFVHFGYKLEFQRGVHIKSPDVFANLMTAVETLCPDVTERFGWAGKTVPHSQDVRSVGFQVLGNKATLLTKAYLYLTSPYNAVIAFFPQL